MDVSPSGMMRERRVDPLDIHTHVEQGGAAKSSPHALIRRTSCKAALGTAGEV